MHFFLHVSVRSFIVFQGQKKLVFYHPARIVFSLLPSMSMYDGMAF